MAAKIKFAFIQSEFFWVAIACLIFKYWLTTKDAADTFGGIIMLAKQTNGTVLWLAALLSARRFVNFIISLKKMPESVGDLEQPKED